MPHIAHPLVSRLKTELEFIPTRLRRPLLQRMATLITELLPEQLYTYDRIFHHITQFHPDTNADTLLSGEQLLHDLGILLQRSSLASPMTAEDPEEHIVSLENVAAGKRVAMRTVRRWALRGMSLAFYQFVDGRYGWGVQQSHLETFLTRRNQNTRRWAAKLSADETHTILERIASLEKANGHSTSAIVQQVSRESGRSTATVRRLLRKHRKDQAAISANSRRYGGLAPARLSELSQQYRRGTPVRTLARDFGRSISTIYRILHRLLVDQILELKISYVPNPDFARADAEAVCLGAEGLFTYPPEASPQMIKAPDGLPPYLRELYAIPLLSRQREKQLFRKYNYLKYRMAMLQEQVRTAGYRARIIDRFEELRQAADHVRHILVRCNLRLVVSIAKRHTGPLATLMDLISEGNMCLMRTVEFYNYARNARFATYATWAIVRHFARVVPEQNYHFNSFVTGRDDIFARVSDARPNPQERVETVAHLRSILAGALKHLSPRERTIIQSHFGTDGRPARTLEDIGKVFGLTRERIRQIEASSFSKLRELIGRDALEALA